MIRKRYVDIMKAIGICLVITGHVEYANQSIKAIVYSFHMPLFFFISGLTLKERKINKARIIILIKRYIVPYCVFGLLYSGYSPRNVKLLLYGSYTAIKEAGSLSSLWFLTVLPLAVVISENAVCFIKSIWGRILVMACLAVVPIFLPRMSIGYPWSVDVSLIATTFVMLGFIIRDCLEDIDIKRSVFIAVFLIILLALLYKKNPINIGGYVLMADRNIGNPIVFYSCALAGCLIVFFLSRIAEYTFCQLGFVEYIGRNTLAILCIHKPIIWELEKIFIAYPASKTLVLITASTVTLAASAIIIAVINEYAPSIVGKV